MSRAKAWTVAAFVLLGLVVIAFPPIDWFDGSRPDGHGDDGPTFPRHVASLDDEPPGIGDVVPRPAAGLGR